MTAIDTSAALAQVHAAVQAATAEAARYATPVHHLPPAPQAQAVQPTIVIHQAAPVAPQRRVTAGGILAGTGVAVGLGALLAEVTAVLLAVGIAALSLALVAVVLRGLVADLRRGGTK